MGKNDRMIWANTPLTPPHRLLIALLLSAAGLSAFGQTIADAASAPQAAASVTPAPKPKPKPLVATSSAATPLPSALASAPTWRELTPSQRRLLAPLEDDWKELSPSQRSKWVNAAPMLATLPEPELSRLHERMRGWSKMSPAERRDARVAFQIAKQVDAEQRQAKWEAYQALPAERRQELADKAAARRKAQAAASGHSAKMLSAQAKSNTVPDAPKLVAPTPVTGSLLQAKPGASTVLITRATLRPSYQAAGKAKVVADPALVDARTLLPKSLKAPSASEPQR
jgi:hypothetical protein